MTFLDLDYETQSWIGQDVDTGKVIEELNIISFNFKVSLIIIIFIVLVLIFSILLFLYKVKNEIDYLTNTYSRKRLYKIKKVVQNADLVFLDLYNFKFINDTYGHNYGDELLRKFAKLLKKKFGSKSVHRFAGDEFIIYLKKSKFTSKQIINNLTSIEIEIYKQERKFEGFRINYGLVPKELNIKKNINDLINIADLLMYDAKKSNKKGNILRAENKNIYLTRYEIVEKINTYGLDNIEPYLQPIIDIQSNKIIGYEALSRLNINGIRISAGMFLRYIKSVVELDLHICHKAMKLHDQMDEDITLHLNISAKSLSAIDSVLMKTDKKIILEILETDKVFDDELFYIEKLIKKGYKFAVDDFGIGNSGMVRIQENYISCVKIDKSILKAKESEKLLFSIKKLVDQLDHSLIVEGVETKEEDALIKKLGVKLAQGFYYNKLYNKLDK